MVIEGFRVVCHMSNNSLELIPIVAFQLANQQILVKLFRKGIPEEVVLDESFIIFGASANH